ncbi:MAG TPA: hypothetical protein DEH25_08100 [Chloroflexi bacterium]|nr:hypothetical protein [Chloroflexota bacterium]
MYKALHFPSNQEIIILDVRWRQQIAYLRSLDQQDKLVCPGCNQPVRVRAGETKSWHFAHKHLQNCPFEKESPALLQARAVLYHWLVDQFGSESVTVEKSLNAPNFPRHVDCWVEKDKLTSAYCIFERRMPPDERHNLKSAFREVGVQVNWVFISDLLHMDSELGQDYLYLTTTERAFLQKSELDQAWQTHFEHLGSSLHYLDSEQEMLITYRNLNVIHLPQLYSGTRLEHPLSEVLAAPANGEFVHPGETDRLQKSRAEIEAQADVAAKRWQKAQDFFRQGSSRLEIFPKPSEKPANPPYERRGTCKFCGQETTDWVTYFGQTNECICRDCKDRF